MSVPLAVLGLVILMIAGTIAAARIRIAYPIVLVLCGAAAAFLPGVPVVALPPDLVFLVFLPPLLYYEALTAPVRQYRRDAWAIGRLAIGLVTLTVAAIAIALHVLRPDYGWALGIVLGAIVSPTDETAVILIARDLRLPRGLQSLIEGESIFNDVVALVIFATALATVDAMSVSITAIVGKLALASLGGILVGIAIAFAALGLRRLTDDPPVTNTISIVTGYAAYLLADAIHASGVLSVVVCALFLSRRAPRSISARARVQNQEFFAVMTYAANGFLFLLVGMELRPILTTLGSAALRNAFGLGIAVALVIFLVRVLWIVTAVLLRQRERLTVKFAIVLSWSGLRGAISLAAALSIPVALHGTPFPHRGEIIVVTYTVILATLVLQGLTLAPLIAALQLPKDDLDREVRMLRERVNAAAKVVSGQEPHDASERERSLRRRALEAERSELLRRFEAGDVHEDVMLRLQRDLDIDEIALDR